jgi:uncharacterized membrane protein
MRPNRGRRAFGEDRQILRSEQAGARGTFKTARTVRMQHHGMEAIAALLLGGLLATAGLTHWAFPRYYASLVPSWMPWPRAVVALTGALDILAGVLTIVPATRSWGAAGAALLVTTYLTSHVDALVHTDRARPRLVDRPVAAVLRIVINLGYLAWAITLARSAGAPG